MTRRSSTTSSRRCAKPSFRPFCTSPGYFPIIRFDAAMTLTKQHYQRLWFPVPGTGGAIPSRSEYGLTKAEFDAAMPVEFWRELVDRVAAEVPGTLLLAEAFWLLEGYFVRTLGMHRVYNSAFMNMLRDEENANYRSVIKNTLEFDPEVLKRYVNFMNNPGRAHGGRPVRQGRQVFRGLHPAGHAAGAADVRPRPDRGFHRALRHGVSPRLSRGNRPTSGWWRAMSAKSLPCCTGARCSPT